MNLLILSRNKTLYSTSRLLEEANQAGHNSAIIDYMHCHVISQQNEPTIHYNGQSLRYIDAIIPRIGSTFTHYGATVIRQFEMQKIPTLVTAQALLKARDKLHCLQSLTNTKLGMPKTFFMHYYYNMDEMITTIGGFPFIMKQLESAQGNGVFLIKDRKHATEIITLHQKANKKFLIQEYIAECKGADIRAFVVGNQVIAAMRRRAQNGDFRSNLHQGGKAEKIELTDEQKNTALIAAKTMGLAVAGVDMIESRRGPLILEVNASPGLEGIEKITKVNIAQHIIKQLEIIAEQQ